LTTLLTVGKELFCCFVLQEMFEMLLVDGAGAKQRHGSGSKQLARKRDGKGRQEPATGKKRQKRKGEGKEGEKKSKVGEGKGKKNHFRK